MLGIPLNPGLAAAVVLAPGAFIAAGRHEALVSAQMLVAATVVTSLLGASLLGGRARLGVRRIRVAVGA
jgi:hypothetical protein